MDLGERSESRSTALRARFVRVRRHLHGAYGVAGVLLSAGLVLAVAGLWALAELTEGVMEGETVRFDQSVLLWLNARATPALDVWAIKVTALGDTLVVLSIAVVAAALLWLLGQAAHAALVAVAVGGASVIYPVLKAVFDRPRPQVFEWRAHYAEASSYPSGHATMAMVLLVVLAYVVHRIGGRRWVGMAAALVAGTAVLLIGASRLYLGVHFPSDVLAGYTVGFAWAVFCALVARMIDRRTGAIAVGRGRERGRGAGRLNETRRG